MDSQEPIGPGNQSFYTSLPNTLAGAAHARMQFMRFIEDVGLSVELVADIQVVIGEALAHAAQQGYVRHGTIRLEAVLTEEYLEASVSDDVPGYSSRGPMPVEQQPHSSRPYGLFLIWTLVDELEFRNDGKTIWFRKRFDATRE